MFFIDQHLRSLDDKSRLTIPADYRPAFAEDGLVVTRLQEPHLIVFPMKRWSDVLQRFQGKPLLTASQLADFRRLLFSNARTTELDSHGRVRLPDHLLAHAQITGQAVVAGAGEHLEVWSPPLWDQKQAELLTIPMTDAEQGILGI
jgi:MraZ protein